MWWPHSTTGTLGRMAPVGLGTSQSPSSTDSPVLCALCSRFPRNPMGSSHRLWCIWVSLRSGSLSQGPSGAMAMSMYPSSLLNPEWHQRSRSPCSTLSSLLLCMALNFHLPWNPNSPCPSRMCFFLSDSTKVLSWLKSDSCRYKVFVGTRTPEIQDLTDVNSWRYVDSQSNPADDVTRGKNLQELAQPQRWSHGPPFLLYPETQWPVYPLSASPLILKKKTKELRKSVACYVTHEPSASTLPDPSIWQTGGLNCSSSQDGLLWSSH